MKTQPTFQETLTFVRRAHASQKYGELPYWTHLEAVWLTGVRIFGDRFDDEAQLAALLHDVLEDTEWTVVGLVREGYSDAVLAPVVLVTKDKALSYEENINRIIESTNVRAMMVKYSDNYVNYTGDKSHWDAKRAAKSQAKYAASMTRLRGALEQVGVDANWPA